MPCDDAAYADQAQIALSDRLLAVLLELGL